MNNIVPVSASTASSALRLADGLRVINQHALESTGNPSLHAFFSKQLDLIAQVLDIPFDGVFVSRAGHLLESNINEEIVVGATSQFKSKVYKTVDIAFTDKQQKLISNCFETKNHKIASSYVLNYLNYSGLDAVLLLELRQPIDDTNVLLLETLCTHIAIKFHSFNLFKKLKTTSFKDWLTKLPNRSDFLNQISKAKSDYYESTIIALVDIKHFSDINDGLSLDIGNSVLLAVASRLRKSFSTDVKIGRITGDVFGLIGSEKDLMPSIIHEVFAAPFVVSSHSLSISVHVGICSLNKRGNSSDFLRCATIALNAAKSSASEDTIVYDTVMEDQSKGRLQLLRDLQKDFSLRALEVWYQPQVDLITEEIVGVEALIRWHTAQGDCISPEDFIPLAEYSGLIVDIGKWVFEQSIKTLKSMRIAGFYGLRMAINVSILQFRDPHFVDFVRRTISDYQVNPSLIELEITEGVVMDEPEMVIKALSDLKKLGVTIAIDDFGTGFSSMSYLQKLPLDRLKVDRSFVSDLNDDKNKVIVQSILTLGAQLGLVTIAEGVETRSQASMMLRMGADEAQGYLFAEAIEPSQLEKTLKAYRQE